jgi:hypothetical protein
VPTPFDHLTAEPPADLRRTRVAVLGCGSAGSAAAWQLAAAGVGRLTLFDRDRIAADNLRRHVCGTGEVGAPKVEAVARFLADRLPAVAVEAFDCDVLAEPDRLRATLVGVDALLVAVDAEGPKYLADIYARSLGVPAVYAGVYGAGWAVEAVRIRPRAAPCYACAAQALGRYGVEFDAPTTPAYAAPRPADGGPAWALADLTSVLPAATLAVRRVVAELTGRDDGPPAAAWRLALRAIPAWGAGPWQLVPVDVPPAADCLACGTEPPPVARFDALLAEGVR